MNCNKLRYPFFIRTGAHEVVRLRPLHRFLPEKFKYLPVRLSPEDLVLYHLLAFDKKSFLKKIENYVSQMQLRKHVIGQGGWAVRDYLRDFTDKEWLNIVQNFRIADSNPGYIKIESDSVFEKTNIFEHLDNSELDTLQKEIDSLEIRPEIHPSSGEKTYLENKRYDTRVHENIKSFAIKKINGRSEILVR